MLKGKLTHVALAAVLAMLPFFVSWGFASQADDKRAELNEVQSQMQKMQDRKEKARQKAEAATVGLEEIQISINQLRSQARDLQGRKDALQAKINDNQIKLAQKKAEVEKRKKIYSKRLREIYINGQINYLDVLLGAKDFGDFSSRMYLLKKIISSDIDMLTQLQKAEAEVKSRQEQLDAQMKDIKTTQAELEAKQARANRLKEQRSYMLYKAQEEEQRSQSEYDRLLAISENITAMLRNMEGSGGSAASSGGGGTGRFMWPCRGVITSYFGWRTHPVFGTTKYHSGMDIGVDYGTPIYAADSGTVIYSGWLGGYGYAVMIDHGSGLVTLYGHNQALNVYEGQYVTKGTCIAYAGSTGYSTGPHCHFEVRLHGEVTEPLNYLPQ
ncbi:MAG: peptidoglycan DD-metalloendopeptidase family protein [Phascolarctobacterium sp.]|nr:peptidoglycan DD-metalloendopeptidase family protein [Phascolarctobacterium sp.]